MVFYQVVSNKVEHIRLLKCIPTSLDFNNVDTKVRCQATKNVVRQVV